MQFEFPWALGPQPGRYPIREHLGEAPAHILVLQTLGAAERRLLPARRRARKAPPDPPPQPVLTVRATLIDTAALDGSAAADRWLRDADLEALAADGLARLNRVLHAHRAATADPTVLPVARSQALVVRVGYGDGERVADGGWDGARELAPASRGAPSAIMRRGGAHPLRPQERLAALLAGRDAVLACEELALRARADLDAGRIREAALQLRAAFEAALAELEPWRDQARLARRLEELRERRGEVDAAADAALRGGLDVEHIETVERVLRGVEAALRARTAAEL
ncbi:MAG TPA: hypothetical protein VF526_02770 [Solirubrobacteraceae bacterium]